jgi:hypothetical protein
MTCSQYDLVIALNETAVALGWRPTQADTGPKQATVTYVTEKEYQKHWYRKPKKQEQEPGPGT